MSEIVTCDCPGTPCVCQPPVGAHTLVKGQRFAACGDLYHVFEVKETLDKHTDETDIKRVWLGIGKK